MTQRNILEDVRVVDFSRYIAGPYCATLLGFLGADVVRVEKPQGGEDRFITPLGEAMSAVFLQTGLNKRSLTLDLKHDESREVVARLVAGADVVVVNMPPAVLSRMGLDYESLKAVKPDIILTTQTCYGHAGPWRDRGGFDGIAQVMSGSAYLSGTPGSPVRAATPFVDFSTAVLGALGTVAALYHREHTGLGQHVQAALLGTAIAAFSPSLIEQSVLALNRVPSGNRGQTSAPTDIFQTADGHVITQVIGGGFFARMARVVGAEEWLEDETLASDAARGERRDEICERVGAWCRARTTAEVVETLAEVGVPCGPVLNLDEAMAHPQVEEMAFLKTLDVEGLPAPARVAGLPVDLSGISPPMRPPPGIGEHTDEILAELGYTGEEIRALRARGVV